MNSMEKRLLAQTADRIAALERERDEALARAERAEARAEKLHAALRECVVAMRFPYCKETPEGHIAYENICRARTAALRWLAAPEEPDATAR